MEAGRNIIKRSSLIWVSYLVFFLVTKIPAFGVLTQKRQLLFYFDKIEVNGEIDVFVEPRKRNEEALIYGDSEIIDKVSLIVRDRTLFIDANNTFDISRRLPFLKIKAERTFPVEIIIGAEKLSALSLYGKANLTVNKISSRQLSIATFGRGRFHLENSFVNSLKINHSGMGAIVLKGEKIRNLDLIVKGAGNVFAQDLPAERIRVQHDGYSNIQLNPIDFIDARLTADGNIFLHNRPENLVVAQRSNGQLLDALPENKRFYDLNASEPTYKK